MDFYKIVDNKKEYLPLLLLADEQEDMIDKYLEIGDMFVLDDNGVKAECVVTKESEGIYELKNIAVDPKFQKKGYGKALIDHVLFYYDDCKILNVGTGDMPSILNFYYKCGFVDSHTIENFFIDNYDHPMYEDGIQLKDMVYLKNETILKTERLRITKFSPSMAKDVCINSHDEDIRAFVPDEFFETEEVALRVINELIISYDSIDGPFVYPIILCTGENIGYVQAYKADDRWEIGYHIAENYSRKGYATEAVSHFLPVILNKVNESSMYALIVPENIASKRVLEKTGFVQEYSEIGNYHGDERIIEIYKYTFDLEKNNDC